MRRYETCIARASPLYDRVMARGVDDAVNPDVSSAPGRSTAPARLPRRRLPPTPRRDTPRGFYAAEPEQADLARAQAFAADICRGDEKVLTELGLPLLRRAYELRRLDAPCVLAIARAVVCRFVIWTRADDLFVSAERLLGYEHLAHVGRASYGHELHLRKHGSRATLCGLRPPRGQSPAWGFLPAELRIMRSRRWASNCEKCERAALNSAGEAKPSFPPPDFGWPDPDQLELIDTACRSALYRALAAETFVPENEDEYAENCDPLSPFALAISTAHRDATLELLRTTLAARGEPLDPLVAGAVTDRVG